ncbi:MAG: 3-dehydroquinate synthase family protein [Planctomycetota bacterium]
MSTLLRELSLRLPGNRETRILVGSGLATRLPEHVAALGASRVFVVVDQAVHDLHPGLVPTKWPRFLLAGGEAAKNFGTLERLLRALAQAEMDRNAVLAAVGGGSIGDLAGLAASLYLRGIDFVQVPTTLLAMVDSSVGGKTAINLREGKNLVGTFWSPRLVLADVDLVQSLPAEQLRSGLAEALKMGIGFCSELFELMSDRRDPILAATPELLVEVVTAAVQSKIAAVEADPLEQNGRRCCLNLGHTLGHALEAHSDYTVLHGHSVARGLHFAVQLAQRRRLMSRDQAVRCHQLLEGYGFQETALPPADELLPYLARDKKMQDGRLHVVLPTGIGACRTVPMDLSELFT